MCSVANPCPVIIVSRAGLIAADGLLVLITWLSLFRKDLYRVNLGTATLAEVLLRDGKCTLPSPESLVMHILCLHRNCIFCVRYSTVYLTHCLLAHSAEM